MKNTLLALTFILFYINAGAQDSTKTSKYLPHIKLKDMNGKEVNVQELSKQGKVLIISFWATLCSPCKKELENMNELIDDWRKKYNVELIAISIDDSRNSMKVKPFVDGKKWDFTVLLDVNQDMQRALNISNCPYTLLVDKNGSIVYRQFGYSEGDEQVLEAKIASLPK